MDELGLLPTQVREWFERHANGHYLLVRVEAETAEGLAAAIDAAVRRCYVSDGVLQARANETGATRAEVLATKLPDPGSTMAGDFGEIFVYLYHAATEHPALAFGPKKWRLKQDRTKPAPHSDVLHFILPRWPVATDQDIVICSEVKTKSTAGEFEPITRAIEGCQKDRLSRLAKTLVWLKERAIGENLGAVEIAHLDRFINAIDYPPARRRYYAIAVVATVPPQGSPDFTLIVITVPNLHAVYNAVYEAVRRSVDEPEAREENGA